MQSIHTVLQDILSNNQYTQIQLAKELEISTSTMSRWLSQRNKPSPLLEGKLRKIHKNLHAMDEKNLKAMIDKALRELREVLHRRGRFSSRNQALEELSKLLFAHVMSILSDKEGISRALVSGKHLELTAVAALKAYVKNAFDRYLPSSLSSELPSSDFELAIKSQENRFALEVIDIFSQLNLSEMKKATLEADLLNDVFGAFLSGSFIDEKQMGQYLTPPEVVQFMTNLALKDMTSEELNLITHPDSCKDFGYIIDPSCGVCSFLAEITRTLYAIVIEQSGHDSGIQWLTNCKSSKLFGHKRC